MAFEFEVGGVVFGPRQQVQRTKQRGKGELGARERVAADQAALISASRALQIEQPDAPELAEGLATTHKARETSVCCEAISAALHLTLPPYMAMNLAIDRPIWNRIALIDMVFLHRRYVSVIID